MTLVHRVRFTAELAYSQLYEFFRLLESWGPCPGSFRSILRFFRHDARLESVACNCKLKLTVEKRSHENAEEKREKKKKKGDLARLESAERNYPRRA